MIILNILINFLKIKFDILFIDSLHEPNQEKFLSLLSIFK